MGCGDFWDFNAAKVVCAEIGLGTPKEVFGVARYGAPTKQYVDFVPICRGDEEKLDDCKMSPLPSPCTSPAGVVCSRTTAGSEGIALDGFPVCADGFTNAEATAVCKEEGYVDGVVTNNTEEATPVPTGWSIKCKTGNLDNCITTLCVGGTAASFTCGEEAEVGIFGGAKPGQGNIFYNGGLVCDDNWDIQVMY